MAKQRLKRIQAGRLVREVLWTPSYPCDNEKNRAEKEKFSSAARQVLNDRFSWQKLKMILATNFTYNDLVVTLTYDDAHYPDSTETARKCLKKFFADLRGSRKQFDLDLHYVYCIESKHGDGRIHHHLVLNGTGKDYELIRSLWIYGTDLEITSLETWGYEELAKYMTKEAREFGRATVGARTWVCSTHLNKPDSPPAQWVDADVRLEPPANAHILWNESFKNAWGSFCYIEYLLPMQSKQAKTRPKKQKLKKVLSYSGLEHCILSERGS